MDEMYAFTWNAAVGSVIGPMAWSVYPSGVELIMPPTLSCDESGAHLTVVVRCTPAIGKQMGWVPLKRPADSA